MSTRTSSSLKTKHVDMVDSNEPAKLPSMASQQHHSRASASACAWVWPTNSDMAKCKSVNLQAKDSEHIVIHQSHMRKQEWQQFFSSCDTRFSPQVSLAGTGFIRLLSCTQCLCFFSLNTCCKNKSLFWDSLLDTSRIKNLSPRIAIWMEMACMCSIKGETQHKNECVWHEV